MKKALIATIGLFLLAAATVFFAAGPGVASFSKDDCEDRMSCIVEMIADELELDASQQGVLEDALTDLKEKGASMKGLRESVHTDMVALVRKDVAAEQDFADLFERGTSQLDQFLDLLGKKLAEFHAVLTPEQREILAEHMEKRMKHRRCFRGHWD